MLMLFIFVIAELGPFVAKTMIDDHIVGIEKPWYETERVKRLFRIMAPL